MTPALAQFYDIVHADDLGARFDASQRCGYEIDSEDLPDDWGGWCCYRPVWDDTGLCIWHAETPRKRSADLHRAQEHERTWPRRFSNVDLTRRLDHANFRGYKVDEARQDHQLRKPLSFNTCTMFGANFSRSNFSQSSFKHVHLNQANFEDAICHYTLFQYCDLDGTIFKYADLENSRVLRQSVQDANWIGVELRNANLHDSDFTGTNLRLAKFTDVHATQATLADCNLEEAEVEQTDLRDADLRNASLYETRFHDIRINEGTQFGAYCTYEQAADNEASELDDGAEAPPGLYGRLRTAARRFLNRGRGKSEDAESLQKATRVYRLYQRLLREASLPEDIRQFRVRERHARRKLALREHRYVQWFKLSFDRWLMLYGESPLRVVGAALGVIVLFALVYPLLGGTDPAATTVSDQLSFSMATFTSLVYGDVQPATDAARLAASLESLTGALLMALLVFVLGRRATW